MLFFVDVYSSRSLSLLDFWTLDDIDDSEDMKVSLAQSNTAPKEAIPSYRPPIVPKPVKPSKGKERE